MSDNGLQYSSDEFELFSKTYGFRHATSSPRFPQSNGLVERMVKTVKQLLQQSDDQYLALLNFHSTPLPWCNLSQAELLMDRCSHTTLTVKNRVSTMPFKNNTPGVLPFLGTELPQVVEHLTPKWTYLTDFWRKDEHFKQKQKNFDSRHWVQDLPDILDESKLAKVWINPDSTPVRRTVLSSAGAPHSYIVSTPTGSLHRNRTHLGIVPDSLPSPWKTLESKSLERSWHKFRLGLYNHPLSFVTRPLERGDVIS